MVPVADKSVESSVLWLTDQNFTRTSQVELWEWRTPSLLKVFLLLRILFFFYVDLWIWSEMSVTSFGQNTETVSVLVVLNLRAQSQTPKSLAVLHRIFANFRLSLESQTWLTSWESLVSLFKLVLCQIKSFPAPFQVHNHDLNVGGGDPAWIILKTEAKR